MKKFLAIASSLAFVFSLLGQTSASAAIKCPDPAKDGKTIGLVSFGNVKVPVKSITYPKGGVMDPPRSPANAGLSARHNPLSADSGSSVITWHVNFNGCIGALNPITKKDVGFAFSIKDEKGATTKYKIVEKFTVPKGSYLDEWFELTGPRQVILVTCTGKFVKGHYQDNVVLVARPA